MKVKSDTSEQGINSILDEFDLVLETETHMPLTVTNKGRQLTFHIMPATYTDKVAHQYSMQQGLIASMNVKEAVQSAIDGYEVDVAADSLKNMNFQVESAAQTSFAYALLAKNVREFAELTQEQLMSKNISSKEKFIEKLLDATATEIIYNAIIGLGKHRLDRKADKVLDVADTVKN